MKRDKGFFVILVCFFVLSLSFAKGDALAVCPGDTVKIAGDAYTSTSIQDAYDYASIDLGLASFTLLLSGEIITDIFQSNDW